MQAAVVKYLEKCSKVGYPVIDEYIFDCACSRFCRWGTLVIFENLSLISMINRVLVFFINCDSKVSAAQIITAPLVRTGAVCVVFSLYTVSPAGLAVVHQFPHTDSSCIQYHICHLPCAARDNPGAWSGTFFARRAVSR